MERETAAIGSIACVLLVVAASFAPFGPVGMAAGNVGNVENRPDAYSVEQGDRCIPLTIVGDASQNVTSYYDYRSSPNSDFSSHGTDDRQVSQVSQFYVYRGENADSLLFLHDRRNDDSPEGGAVSMDIQNIPEQASWSVEDDNYSEEADDRFIHGETRSRVDWVWAPERTDGGALSGMGHVNDSGITIQAAFGNDTYAARELDSPYADGNLSWAARGPDERLAPLSKSESVTVRQGGCPTNTAPNADLTVTPETATPGTTVTLDASASTDPDGIYRYYWDVDNDGTIDNTTTTPTLQQTYDTIGQRTVRVVVEDTTRLRSEATATVNVTAGTVSATINAPTQATVSEPVAFDGSNSTASPGATYEWTFGDGTTATGQQVSHTYAQTGQFNVTLNVTESTGERDSATATVTVGLNESRDPTASLSAPATVQAGTSATLDASNSTAPRGSATYEWDLNGDGTPENVTTTPTLTTTFGTVGNQTVSVTVVDGANRTDTATATVTVGLNENRDPTASLSAPATVQAGTSVTLDASNSTAPRGSATYEWDLNGDGTPENVTTTPTLTTTFGTVGNQTVSVTVVDGANRTDTASAPVSVTVDERLSATIRADASQSEPGESVGFSLGASPSERVVDRSIDFGDGETATNVGTSVRHVFDDPGTYTVSYTATGRFGQTASATTAVTVERQASSGGGGGSDSGGSSGGGGGGSDDDDSGDSGGSGGSSLPPAPEPTPEPESEQTTVTQTVGTLNVTFAEATDRFETRLDDGTLGPSEVRVRRVAFSNVSADTTVTVRDEWNGTTEPPNGTDRTPLALGPSVSGGSASSVTYQLAIDREWVRSQGGSVGSLTPATWSGSEWEPAEGTVVRNGSTVVMNVTADPAAPMALGVATPQVSGESIGTAGSPVVGQPLIVTATLSNTGHRDGTETVTTVLGGRVVASEQVTVPAGGTADLSFTITPTRAGTQELSLAGQSRTLEVAESVASIGSPSVSVAKSRVAPGETVRVNATFTNDGTAAGNVSAEFVAFGDVVETERMQLEPGESRTVTFEQRIERPGEYALSVNGQNATVTVDGEVTQTEETFVGGSGGSGDGGSRSPLTLALLAVGGVGVVVGGIVVLTRQL
ncbi:PKD domain-containing protein [Haloarcula marina]|uniref:PKD domain-containing protein n=1 Tax=Haloarcula marina TaxID=2961574 RepID=UPI0020B754EC|nr:PKD domain-containing protein [Halomicroarcula marina]